MTPPLHNILGFTDGEFFITSNADFQAIEGAEYESEPLIDVTSISGELPPGLEFVQNDFGVGVIKGTPERVFDVTPELYLDGSFEGTGGEPETFELGDTEIIKKRYEFDLQGLDISEEPYTISTSHIDLALNWSLVREDFLAAEDGEFFGIKEGIIRRARGERERPVFSGPTTISDEVRLINGVPERLDPNTVSGTGLSSRDPIVLYNHTYNLIYAAYRVDGGNKLVIGGIYDGRTGNSYQLLGVQF